MGVLVSVISLLGIMFAFLQEVTGNIYPNLNEIIIGGISSISLIMPERHSSITNLGCVSLNSVR